MNKATRSAMAWSAVMLLAAVCSSDNGAADGGQCRSEATSSNPDCNACVEENCCDELAACGPGTPCAACLEHDAACTAETEQQAVELGLCAIAQCEQRCPELSAGGTGGSGGTTGGTGGSSASGGTGASGATGGSAGTTGGTGGSAAGGTGGTSCSDPSASEPNETEAAAEDLGTATDCDNTGFTLGPLVLRPDGEADWFRYFGDDQAGCILDPAVTVTNADQGLRVCAYADCGPGGVSVTCDSGTPATSPSGLSGCCSATGGQVAFGVDCQSGSADDADIFVRVDQPTPQACVSYELMYRY